MNPVAAPPATHSDRARMRRAIVTVVLRAIIVYAVAQLVITAVLVFNFKSDRPIGETLRTQAFDSGGVEQVEFRSQDGLSLRGELLGGTRRGPVVVYGHGYRHMRREGDPLARELLTRGASILLFDFRGGGASQGSITTLGAVEERDVAGALRFLEGRGVSRSRIGYVGFSMGAAAGLNAATHLKGLGAVVLIAPYARLLDTFEKRTLHFSGLPLMPFFFPAVKLYAAIARVDPAACNPIDRIAELGSTPVMIVGGSRDWRAPIDELFEMRARCVGPCELIGIENADHYDLSRLPPEVLAPILSFLEAHLPKAPAR